MKVCEFATGGVARRLGFACPMRSPALAIAIPIALALAACNRQPKAAYRTDVVSKGAISEVVSATGDVSAVVTVNVGSQISGTIAKLHVDFNSPVKKGQVLAEIDPRLFNAALGRAVAGLAAARADVVKSRVALADAQRIERRTAELAKGKLIAQADLDTAAANREGAAAGLVGAEARVLQAQADRDTAATNVALCKILSPIDGVVISRSIDVGQTVAASLQAPTLFLIANDLTQMQILANVDEADVGKVKDGLTARFSVDAFPGEPFEGRIREVRQSPSTIQNVVTYAAVIEAPNPERKLRQGMTASVTIVTNQRNDALRVPNAALRFRPASEGEAPATGGAPGRGSRPSAGAATAGGSGTRGLARGGAGPGAAGDRKGARRGRVYKLEGGVAKGVDIQVGISDGRQTEVLSGLAEGDVVIVGDAAAPGTAGAPQGGPRRGLF